MAPTLEAEIGGAWTARLTGFYGTDKTYGVTQNFTNDVEARSIRIFDNRSVSVEAGIEGPLFTLPGGDVRLAAGGGWRSTRIVALVAGRNFAPTPENRVAYGTLFVPLPGPPPDLPFPPPPSLH